MAGVKHTPENDINALEQEYKLITSLVARFCQQLAAQIGQLLDNAEVGLGFPVSFRVKTWDSIQEKLQRVPLRLTGIRDLQDLAGLRIIVLFRRDTQVVGELIRKHFNVMREYDTLDRLKEDQFGYTSRHFIIELPEGWLTIPTLAGMGGLQAEIQLRTIAQHNWAEVSHKLQYKQEAGVPKSLLRAIYRSSALLELVDIEFERLLIERESYRSDIDLLTLSDTEELNVDLLEKILDELLPAQNKDGTEDYALLLAELNVAGIKTRADLKHMVEAHLEIALDDDHRRVIEKQQLIDSTGEATGTTVERVHAGVYYTHVGLARIILDAAFPDTARALRRAKTRKVRSSSRVKLSPKSAGDSQSE